MVRHGSASTRKHESHTNQNTQLRPDAIGSALDADWATAVRESDLTGVPLVLRDIDADVKRHARKLAVDGLVDHGTRRMARYALENRHPYLVLLLRYPRFKY